MHTYQKEQNVKDTRRIQQKTCHELTRHSVTVEVVSDGLLQFVVRRGLLEALAQILLQVLGQLASCDCEHKCIKTTEVKSRPAHIKTSQEPK